MVFKRHVVPDSSNIDYVEYDDKKKGTQQIIVGFKSQTSYYYYDVPTKLVTEMLLAPSVGSFFYHNIRTKYDYGQYSAGD